MGSSGKSIQVAAAFGVVLRAHRHHRGLSQEQLAHDAGVDRTYIGLLERGLRQPTIGTVFALAAALDVLPETLIVETRQTLS
jgi:transcriptional regulator with XRE-family HTH domain